ncbi:hypothetical protein ARC20_01635 [Stenotrophomonas panacihumi]|uniref:Uncharacterized protein n=1 Tax=Stenotrophomonas panacihumi TaxID=676599 RepID=A0A0R0A9E1_9GAMM|nr:hypothetical protein [Stenotrophomonas panacihumi]KRG39154.1 hypothetical protein ARC20_01635 [Stenotrophomonas panacihumi]PTN53079.1 hypothetical protein C9J98_17495 [Stenotrophomonas panacihumi]
MNAVLAFDIHPLPSPLFRPATAGRRRRHIGDFEPDADVLARFNIVLAQLGWRRPPLDHDQLASAARELDRQPAPCIALRVQQAEQVARMLHDRAWQTDARALPAAHEVAAYLQADWHLLPSDLPGAARLDDALALDTAWPQLRAELLSYQDFRRLRAMEAQHRGCRDEEVAFDRQAWREARELEARLFEQTRRVRERSYAPAAPACFRVH